MTEDPIEDAAAASGMSIDDVRRAVDRMISKPLPDASMFLLAFDETVQADVITDMLATMHALREQPFEPYTITLPPHLYNVWRFSDRTLYELDGYVIEGDMLVRGWAH